MMKRSFRFAVAAVMMACASTPVLAQQAQPLTPADIAKIKTDVTEAARNYLKTYSSRDTKGVATNSYSHPGISINANGVNIIEPDKQAAQLETAMKRLADTGWDRSEFVNPNVCVLNANVALMSSRFRRYKKDGTFIAESAETDLFARTKDGWKMVALFGTDVNKLVTCSD